MLTASTACCICTALTRVLTYLCDECGTLGAVRIGKKHMQSGGERVREHCHSRPKSPECEFAGNADAATIVLCGSCACACGVKRKQKVDVRSDRLVFNYQE